MTIKFKNIFAYEVLDSRGYPTVAVLASVESEESKFFSKKTITASAKAMVPSGASTGQKEALELRDGDKTRYNGKGVKKAVYYVNEVIAPYLLKSNINPLNQEELDKAMIALDGTDNKSQYGANAILAVSLAVAKACARIKNMPFYAYVSQLQKDPKLASTHGKHILPVPMVNVINGGEHADNTIDFQEFMFMPIGAKSMHEAVRVASECFHALQAILHAKGYNTNKGDEGGFAPNLSSAEEALTLMVQAVLKAKYLPGISKGQVAFALDCAASELYDKTNHLYKFKKAIAAGILSKSKGTKTTAEMIQYFEELITKFPIISIEDPLDETDWDGWQALVEQIGTKIQIVGDDLFCTNPRITRDGVDKKVANAVLVKVNQIGTLTETLETVRIAREAGWNIIISHRSGETEDTSIADIAVGVNSGQIKTGSMSRSERIAKYNRLLEIEMELGKKHSSYRGLATFNELDLAAIEAADQKTYLALSDEKSMSLVSKLGSKTTKISKNKTKKVVKPLSNSLLNEINIVETVNDEKPKKTAAVKKKASKTAEVKLESKVSKLSRTKTKSDKKTKKLSQPEVIVGVDTKKPKTSKSKKPKNKK